ncbi:MULTISPECIES: hypothetical protein [unclassified Aureimonas]|uniref:hypothetical protein n=1 Tax=unclassified Aureimonas TaxID=2615206 RepID=UPI000A623638|nr:MULTISPECIES: hypothetical protein [unclassified Aureimonas]
MSARSHVLDGASRAASLAAAEARLSAILGWAVRGDIIIGTTEAGAGARPGSVTQS